MATFIGGGDAQLRDGLDIPVHDYQSNTYNGENLTETVYKRGGASDVVVATVTRTYNESGKLLTVTRI
jgi:hypothetical protein